MAQSDQVPTQSGFGAKTEGSEVVSGIDLSGKVAIVTGGYSGIGLETTKVLVESGAQVIVPVRDEDKAKHALSGLEGNVRTAPLDLGERESIEAFASAMLDELSRLDLLINNAGIMACPEARVGSGWESQFGVNHMGHFNLTRALMPLLEKTEGTRVVALSSAAHHISDIRWEDIQFRIDPYDKWRAYGQSKTANALFANALSRRLKASGGLAFSLHPGAIFTPLQRHLPQDEQVAMGWLDEQGEPTASAKKNFKTPSQGCSTTLWAATSPKLEGISGVYCENCDIAVVTGPDTPRFSGVQPYACDDEAAEKLWSLSESLLT